MENAETILVIILSTFLAIFLVCGIILLVKCIQIASQVKVITDKAESLVEKAESVGDFFQQASGKFAMGRLISHLANSVFDSESKDKKGK